MIKNPVPLSSQITSRRHFLKTSTIAASGVYLNLMVVRGASEKPKAGREPASSPTDKVIKLFNGKDLTGLYT